MTCALVFAVALLADAAQLGTLEARLTADPENLKAGAEYRQLAIDENAYDRATAFLEQLSARPNAGPHVYLTLALAYIDKIPTVGSFKRISIGNKATKAVTRSIELQPWEVSYAVRGMIDLRFEKGFYHRTPQGVADLEQARRLSGTHSRSPYVAQIYLALGDGYWRLKNHAKAREVWQEGSKLFPTDAHLRERLMSPDNVVTDAIDKALDPATRVDTSLRGVIQDGNLESRFK
jgi:tetratricopeptide (TPR) repeat protein